MTLTGAFVPGPRAHVPGAAAGPLAGLSFAVKDLIDVASVPTGGGNPDWPRFAPTPTVTHGPCRPCSMPAPRSRARRGRIVSAERISNVPANRQ